MRLATTLGAVMVFGAAIASFSGKSHAFNEPRWYQQQVCLASAYQAVNDPSKAADHKAKALKSRRKLASAGIPASHIRELANRSLQMLEYGISGNKEARGPRLCQQWYPLG